MLFICTKQLLSDQHRGKENSAMFLALSSTLWMGKIKLSEINFFLLSW